MMQDPETSDHSSVNDLAVLRSAPTEGSDDSHAQRDVS